MKAKFEDGDLLIRIEPTDADYSRYVGRFRAFRSGGESAMLSVCQIPDKIDHSLDVFLAHDIHNRQAQGILNRSLELDLELTLLVYHLDLFISMQVNTRR